MLISAHSARGLSSDVFRYVLAEHGVLLSEQVLSEFERVATQRFGIPTAIVSDFLEELRLHEVVGDVSVLPDLDVIRDPDDRVVVAAALEGAAEVLVTGDKDILDVRDHRAGIKAINPREFWESVRKSE